MKSTQNVIHKNISDKKKSLALTGLDSGPDTLTWWLEQYLSHGVTTSKSSQQAQYKDIIHFIMFMLREDGTEDRPRWTPRPCFRKKNFFFDDSYYHKKYFFCGKNVVIIDLKAFI